MLRFNDDFDFRSEFVGKWNKKIHSLRVAGIIVAINDYLCYSMHDLSSKISYYNWYDCNRVNSYFRNLSDH